MPYAAFRRQAVPQQYAQALRTTTFPAPTRGIVLNENESYMQPGGAIIQDNWMSTMQGVKLRAGFIRWCDLHALDTVVPPVPDASRQPVISAFEYVSGSQQRMYAGQQTKLFDVTSHIDVVSCRGTGKPACLMTANALTRLRSKSCMACTTQTMNSSSKERSLAAGGCGRLIKTTNPASRVRGEVSVI
jgi:hypothetical protein